MKTLHKLFIHKYFGLVIYIFVIYKMTTLLFSMFC